MSSAGTQAAGTSRDASISADGRFVAFASTANNLVPDDSGFNDVFVHDRDTGATTRISVGSAGTQPNGRSDVPSISADGRWVAFQSLASNLVPDDTNGASDVFVHDRLTGTTSRVSLGPGGVEGNGLSGSPSISADGRFVAFRSEASTLVVDDTNGVADVFVADRMDGTVTRVSVGPGGSQGNDLSGPPAMTPDGRWIGFASRAGNLVPGDTNLTYDVFVHDRQTGTTTRVSVGPGGVQANHYSQLRPALSADGRWVAFSSAASNLVAGDTNNVEDTFLHDQLTGTVTRISVRTGGMESNAGSWPDSISADGRWAAFSSAATNLVAADTNGTDDVFVHDRTTGATTRVSVGTGGIEADGRSAWPATSADGRWVAFTSLATNLVPGDTNAVADVFLLDRGDTGCLVALVPTSATAPAAGGPGSVGVTASSGCAWTASSSAPAWLTVTAGSPGSGNGVVSYTVAANAGPARTGTLTIGGQTFTLDQDGAGTAPPVTEPDSYATTRDTPMVIEAPGVLANDNSPGGGAMTAQLVATVSHGALALALSGAFTYTPASGFVGIDSFTYRAANANGPGNTATATITVINPTAVQPPTDLVVDAVQDRLVTVRFSPPPLGPAPTGYVLKGGVAPGQVLAALPTGHAAPVFTFLAPVGSFHIRMHTLADGAESGPSNEVPLHVGVPVPPSAPSRLTGMVNGSSVALAWRHTFEGGPAAETLLDVTGTHSTTLSLGPAESFSFAAVPDGVYTFRVRGANAGGAGPPSDAVTLAFPSACSGVPREPDQFIAYAVGATIYARWNPPGEGPSPTHYVLTVTGAFTGTFQTAARSLSGTAGSGSYGLRVRAVNSCGDGPATAEQVVTVP